MLQLFLYLNHFIATGTPIRNCFHINSFHKVNSCKKVNENKGNLNIEINPATVTLSDEVIDLEKDTFYDTGGVTISGARIRCWKAGGHGAETYLQVVENSCNTGFVSLGFKLGKEKLFDYIKKFGFGSKTGVDLNGEENGILFNLDRVGDLELATTSFGQGVSVTPIHLTV